MNQEDGGQNDDQAWEVGEAFSLAPAKGKPLELSLQDSYGRFGWLRLVPPHPVPLPQGEGTPHPASFLSRASLPLARCAQRFNAETPARPSAFDSPRSGARFSLSPREGWGEGEKPRPRWRDPGAPIRRHPTMSLSPFQAERECTTEMWHILGT